MEKDVCEFCGKANGWHLWGCPGLKVYHVQLFGIDSPERKAWADEMREEGESYLAVTPLKTLPEVE